MYKHDVLLLSYVFKEYSRIINISIIYFIFSMVEGSGDLWETVAYL